MLARGPQIFLDGAAQVAARGGAGLTMRENVAAKELLEAAGYVSDGYSADGTSITGAEPEDYLLGPNIRTSAPLVFTRSPISTVAGEADFDFVHQSPLTTDTDGNLHFVIRIILEPGANDSSEYWGIISRARTNSTSTTANLVGGYFQSWRNVNSRAPIWAAIAEAADFTGLNSADVGAATSSMEIDIGTTGLDNAVNPSKWGGFGNRHLIHFVATRNQGSDENEVSTGLWFGTNQTRLNSVIGLQQATRTYQVLDTRGAVPPFGGTEPVAAVRMQQGQVIDFNGGPALNSPNSRHLRYIDSLGRLTYFADTNELFRIQDDGVVLAAMSFESPSISVTGDTNLLFTNQTTAAAAETATLTNAPTAGNPNFWLKVHINGVLHKIPAWL